MHTIFSKKQEIFLLFLSFLSIIVSFIAIISAMITARKLSAQNIKLENLLTANEANLKNQTDEINNIVKTNFQTQAEKKVKQQNISEKISGTPSIQCQLINEKQNTINFLK